MKNISLEEIKLMKENGSFNFIEKNIFYKGIASQNFINDYLIFNDKEIVKRNSKTTQEYGNFYNMLLNNLDSWKNLPLRQNSLIFSTSLTTAKSFGLPITSKNLDYGKAFKIYPHKEAQIVVSPKDDIWYCFKNALSKIGLLKKTLIELNNSYYEITSQIDSERKFDNNLNEVQELAELIKQKSITNNLSESALRLYDYLTSNNLIDNLNEDFSPSKNDFQTYEADNFPESIVNKEIWTDAITLLINIETDLSNL